MKINEFWFNILMVVAIAVCCGCFKYTAITRTTDSIGSEVFVIALPLLIMKWRSWTVELETRKKNQSIKELKKALNKSLTNM